MKQLELWRWRMRDHRGMVHATRFALTEADALARDPQAVRVPGSREVRTVPADDAELGTAMASWSSSRVTSARR